MRKREHKYYEKIYCCGVIGFIFLSLAACPGGLEDNDIELEFELDGLAVKTITISYVDAWGPINYCRYDFEKSEFFTWYYSPYVEESENPYSEPVVEMTFTKEQAVIFLDDLEKAGMFQLEKGYNSKGIIMDGAGWGIEAMLADGDIFTCGGWNAYPPIKVRKDMDAAATKLGNPKRFWFSEEWAEKYGYFDSLPAGKSHNYYPGCTVRIDLRDKINWTNGYRDSDGNAIDENYRLQRLIDMRKYYAGLSAGFIYEAEEAYPSGSGTRIVQKIKPEFFEFDARFEQEGIEYTVSVNTYLPHIRIDFYGRDEYKDHLNNIEMTDMNYFKGVIGKFRKELSKLETVKSAEVYWAPDWRK